MRLTLMTIKRNGLEQVANEFIKTFHHDGNSYPFDNCSIWKEMRSVKKTIYDEIGRTRTQAADVREGEGRGDFG